jgi:nucleoid DNA-binding protein
MAKKMKSNKTTAKAKTKTAGKTTAAAAPKKAAKPEKVVTPLAKIQPATTPRTKSEILTLLAETTGLSRKEVSNVFLSMNDLIGKDVGKKGCGLFTVPGLMKIRRVNRPATKARKGINPFTGEEVMFKAKPARNVVKIRPLKALKDMV